MGAVPRTVAYRWLLLGCLLGLVLLFVGWTEANRPVHGPHGRLELALLRSTDSLTVSIGQYFTTAGRCAGCHGRDLQGIASVDADGNDVNVVDDWRSTMMANSARDPFWRAKVSHEVLVNPQHQEAIESTCLGCHAPLAFHEERMLGNPPFTMAMLDTSSLGLDGVSCLSCHMQSEALAGTFFSGQLEFDSAIVYGPYAEDQINPAIMEFFVGFRPTFGEHMVNSAACAGCHTLITQTLDLDGFPTGDHFVEQATYHEWLNSVYSENGTQCNTCHMPRIDDPIILAAEYIFLNPQTPFGLHHLVGGNVHMLELMKANREVLGIPATEAHFDSTIARTRKLLTERTLDTELWLVDRDSDTARFGLELINKAGHRFPSGYPSRRAFITFVVLTADNDTLFKSGLLQSDYEVEGHDVGYEPHYDVIRSTDQVQIYELVMGDVNGNVTTVLERAKEPLKDNRLVPLGFTTLHPVYDTTLIAGVPPSDLDFNRDAFGVEGSGTDIVRYHVAMNGYSGVLRVHASVYYQPVPPGWNAEMFSFSSPEIDAFRDMLEASDGTPTRVAMDTLFVGSLGMHHQVADRVLLFPNPTADGWISVTGRHGAQVEVLAAYDMAGRQVAMQLERHTRGWRVRLPTAQGTYLLQLRVDGRPLLQRVVRR
jgi:hypothetical protein